MSNIGKSMDIEHSQNIETELEDSTQSSIEPEKKRTYATKAKQLTPVGTKTKRRPGRPSKKEMEYVALKTKRKKSLTLFERGLTGAPAGTPVKIQGWPYN